MRPCARFQETQAIVKRRENQAMKLEGTIESNRHAQVTLQQKGPSIHGLAGSST